MPPCAAIECARRGESWKQKQLTLVAELGQRRRRARARQPGADDDHVVFPLVRRVHQLHLEAVLVPLLRERAGRNARVQFDGHSALTARSRA